MLFLGLSLALATAACNKNKGTCDDYAELAMKCDKDSSMSDDEKSGAKTMLSSMCIAAFDDEYAGAKGDERKMMEQMYAHVKEVATCASKVKTCEEYAKCEDAAKKK